ncbi:hypothetical protein Q7C36_021064 [Tachysurus vachellii]|uniref:Uncharacterized protein n=1 Tax=Tachysurus vachellii TaxID=175792 RepID=A0AA88IRK7_TACVA|nr:hypothetical protein Q7C36_021064 [Tachysurus vachellii]
METHHFHTGNVSESSRRKRSESPTHSCISMKSDGSMDVPLKFKDGDSSLPHSKTPAGYFTYSHLDISVMELSG